MKRPQLTPREKEAFDFIRANIKAHGIPPTYEEIAGHLGSAKSKAAALYIVDSLVAMGLLRRLPQRARGLQLVETEDDNAPYCACGTCALADYLTQRKLVEALSVPPPDHLRGKLNNTKALSTRTRIYWRDGFPPSLTGDAA